MFPKNTDQRGDFSVFAFRATGRYFSLSWRGVAMGTHTNTTIGRLFAGGFYTAKNLKIDRIAMYVTTGSASAKARAGIYENIIDMYPGALIVQGAEADCSTTGLKETSIDITLQGGKLYWFVWWSNSGSAMTVRANSVNMWGRFLEIDPTNTSTMLSHLYYASSYPAGGALPDPFPSSATKSTGNIPAVYVRIA